MRNDLESLSVYQLRSLAKQLGLRIYSLLRKADLIDVLEGEPGLAELMRPSWWQKHHNHAYGALTIAGVILTVVFFGWQELTKKIPDTPRLEGAEYHQVPDVQGPISLQSFAALLDGPRAEKFRELAGQNVIWEGYVTGTSGFQLHAQGDFPFEKPLTFFLKPTRSPGRQVTVTLKVEPVLPTVGGYDFMTILHRVQVGPRLRFRGVLGGSENAPVLHDGWIEDAFPLEQ